MSDFVRLQTMRNGGSCPLPVPSREWLELGVGVVSGVSNLESSVVRAPDRRLRHDKDYHECGSRSSWG